MVVGKQAYLDATLRRSGRNRPRAEGAYSDGNIGHGGYPLAIDNFSVANSRPIILNRPFRSVAELGYASRGMPWKNLDFFTAESGDGALLDVFCLKASGTAGVVAGVVDINSAPQDVLETLLAGVAKTESSSDTISSSDATSLATQLRDQIVNNGPFLYRNELVTRFSGNAMFSSDADRIIKRAGNRRFAPWPMWPICGHGTFSLTSSPRADATRPRRPR